MYKMQNKKIYPSHYSDVIMGTMVSQITSLAIVYSSVYSGADQRKHQNSASLAFVRGIHRWPVISPHKRPVTRKIFPFDEVIMKWVRGSVSSQIISREDSDTDQLYPHNYIPYTRLIWGLWRHKQVSEAGISNYIPQFTVGCNYLSPPQIPALAPKSCGM